jgi:hypothetical protein
MRRAGSSVVPAAMSSPRRPMCLCRRHRRGDGDRSVSGRLGPLGRQHGVGASRDRCPGHDADGLPARDASLEWRARQRVADDPQRGPGVRRGAFRVIRHHRVPVHRRAIETGDVEVGHDRRRQHAPVRRLERHLFGYERPQLRVEPRQRLAHRVAVREAPHADVVRRSGSAGHAPLSLSCAGRVRCRAGGSFSGSPGHRPGMGLGADDSAAAGLSTAWSFQGSAA